MFKILVFIITILPALSQSKKVFIELKSKDIFVGELLEKTIRVKSEYGFLKVEFDKFNEIAFREKAQIDFTNGDLLEAEIENKSFRLKSEFGVLEFKQEQILRISKSLKTALSSDFAWSKKINGLSAGIKINKKKAKKGDKVVVTAVLLNNSREEIEVPHPDFPDNLENVENQKKNSALIYTTMDQFEEMADVTEADSKDLIVLSPGAMIIIDFELLISDEHRLTSERMLDLNDEASKMIVLDKIHFVQSYYYKPLDGINHVIVNFGVGNGKSIKTSKVFLEYSQ